MKKLIAISVMLVLLTGAAFAQISGDYLAASRLVRLDDGDDVMMGGLTFAAKWSITFGEAPGTGRIVYRLHDDDLWGWFAWRPIDLLRIKFGWDRDGEWGRAFINGWGFTAGAKDLVAVNDYGGGYNPSGGIAVSGAGRGDPWYPGIGDGDHFALMFSLYPMDGLQVNFGLPRFGASLTEMYGSPVAGRTEEEMSLKISLFHASLFYNIEDIGQVTLAFVGQGGLGKDKEKTASVGDIYASFYLTAIDGIRLDLGFKMGIPFTNAGDKTQGGRMNIGLGLSMPSVIENLSFKLRGGALIGGTNDAGNALATEFMVGIIPTYTIAPGFLFYFHAGLGMNMPEQGDSNMAWFVNPYISYRAGGITFWSGIQVRQLNSIGSDAAKAIQFSIPFGFSANY